MNNIGPEEGPQGLKRGRYEPGLEYKGMKEIIPKFLVDYDQHCEHA